MIDLKSLLNEERSLGKNPAASYKVSVFQDLDSRIAAIGSDEEKEDLRGEALRLLDSNQGSIILDYISGRVKLFINPHEYNVRLNNLIVSFYESRNWEVVEYIGKLVLEESESKVALRTLGDVASEKGQDDLKWNYYERYVKADNQDEEIIILVADHFEETGDKKNAMNYYQRALLRLAKNENDSRIRLIFTKLVQNGRTEFPFYQSFIDGLYDRNAELCDSLYRIMLGALQDERKSLGADKQLEKKRNLDNTIVIARQILSIVPDDQDVRAVLIDTLKEKYAGSDRLSHCLSRYRIQSAADPVKALADFEKDISYSKNAFVFQKSTRRVGLIVDVSGGKVKVRYSGSEPEQVISIENAFDTLQPLSKQNIKAIKKGVPAAKIKAKIFAEGGIEWLVRTLLFSAQDNRLSLKDMKSECVPSIMTDSDWKEISDRIKDVLKTNPYVRIIPGATDIYELTAYPYTQEEKQLYVFRNERGFYGKVDTLLQAFSDKSIEKTSDAFMEMVNYFELALDDKARTIDEIFSSVLILDYLSENKVSVSFSVPFENMYNDLTDLEKKEVFASIENSLIKREFIDQVVKCDRQAADMLIQLFPLYVSSYIPTKLQRISKGKYFYSLIAKSIDNFRDNIPTFLYFACEYNLTDEILKASGVDKNKVFRSKLMALSFIAKATQNTETKKNIRTLRKDLIDNKGIAAFISKATKSDIDECRSLILFNEGLETEEKNDFKAMILKRFPDYDFQDSKKAVKPTEVKVVAGFLCTESSYNRKKEELKDINTVQMPAILKEINYARELGDLRENSEYQYAKEHKRELERRIGELNNDLGSVRIMTKDDVIPDMIGFGTKVVLHDNIEKKDIDYTFLGRWESAPEERIIDLNAPLGQKLINHKVGDNVVFTINNRDFDLTVKSIEPIDFS